MATAVQKGKSALLVRRRKILSKKTKCLRSGDQGSAAGRKKTLEVFEGC